MSRRGAQSQRAEQKRRVRAVRRTGRAPKGLPGAGSRKPIRRMLPAEPAGASSTWRIVPESCPRCAVRGCEGECKTPLARYRILWDNGHANGFLSETFTNRRHAERAAVAWKREMVAMEPTEAERRAARAVYEWEIVEVDDGEAEA